MSDSPVLIDEENKIKLKPELMIVEKIYPILIDNSIFLFYKDENEMINCYEVVDKEIVQKAQKNPEKIIDIIEELDK
ncbi:MAG: hypothetical protein AB7V56_02125 [Candidatus Nitrosocosmicus sp.]|jgi:hypothetical protein|uniref:hypothetical protein n=1 Tax=Candidatus Nitrosocosmicus agrestis TaxID=2563600 RepID=UPI00122E1D7C|nr:hypothetical protein [Candidatus Nitrosocosmicus sp. SS]KAA2279851.1 hypothetical protein F1Z66_12360 [Candidatus Nitrosocosmicus sp. SS]KAF0870379.1 hypothetical protein E5N71_00635 [Candidatus Nitrosocosmicus sp. SS]HET6589437.1 hypothetical protein [Candidatus Nitrosocosmicus sp.]